MTRAFLVAALAAVPALAPAAQPMRAGAGPVAGTLRPRADRPAEAVDFTARTVAPTGMDDCLGFVDPSAPDAVVEWPGGDLRVAVRAGFDATLAVSRPDGTWACNDDAEGLSPVVEAPGAPRGRYAVWVGSIVEDPEVPEVTLIAGRPEAAPVADPRGAPTGGTVRAEAGFEARNGMIAQSVRAGGRDAVAAMGVLPADGELGCVGFVDAATPTAVVAYSGGGPGTVVLTAASPDVTVPLDLVLLVHTPGGAWLCNDDYGSADPTVVVEGAQDGDYAVWVGTYTGAARTSANAATLTLSETAPPPPEDFGMDFDDMDFGDLAMDTTPYSEGAYMPLELTGRPAVRLVAGDEPAEQTVPLVPEGRSPVQGSLCSGFVTAAPTATVELSGAGPLAITARSDDADLVLFVLTPGGRWFCSDDADGLNPGVQFGSADDPTAETGTYRVWVGTLGDASGLLDPSMDVSMMDDEMMTDTTMMDDGMTEDGMTEDGMTEDGMTEDGMTEDAGPLQVTVSAQRGEIVVTEPDYGMDGMDVDVPDFTVGVYDGADLRPDDALQTVQIVGGEATARVTAGGALINPVDGEACAGFVDARPAVAFTAEAHDALTVTATSAEGEDLVMLVRTPSGAWYCSDDGEGSDPLVGLAPAEPGRHTVWVGTFSRRPDGTPAEVVVAVEIAMGE